MANTTYQSPVIAAPNAAAKRVTAYDTAIVLLQHIRDLTGGYNIDLVQLDVFITTPQRITVTTTNPIPDLAERFPGKLTQTSP